MQEIALRISNRQTGRRCLLCNDEDMGKQNLLSYLVSTDLICDDCRMKFIRVDKSIQIEKMEVYILYEYNEMMSSALLQYKGSCDEALAPLFMFCDLKRFDRRYWGYTIVYIPSSEQMNKERGFRHLEKMFEFSKLEKADILIKKINAEQKKLNVKERRKMSENIRIKDNIRIPEKIILVDDVITTGSSMSGAYDALSGKCGDIKAFCVSCNKSWL